MCGRELRHACWNSLPERVFVYCELIMLWTLTVPGEMSLHSHCELSGTGACELSGTGAWLISPQCRQRLRLIGDDQW
jgi:hypothetical protein